MLFKRIRYGIFLLPVLLSGCDSSAERLPTPAEVLPDTGLYTRITPEEDSAKNMRTIYQNRKDTSDLIYLYYWNDGNLMGTSQFTGNESNGTWYAFHPSGNIWFRIRYKNNKKESNESYFDNSSHSLSNISMFNKEGREDGSVKYDSASGQVKQRTMYIYENGDMPAGFRQYDSLGNLVSKKKQPYIYYRGKFIENLE